MDLNSARREDCFKTIKAYSICHNGSYATAINRFFGWDDPTLRRLMKMTWS